MTAEVPVDGHTPTETPYVEYTTPEDATPAQATLYAQMAELTAENFGTFVEKNTDYGSSFLIAGEIDVALGIAEDPTVANLQKLWTRIGDKHARFGHLAFTEDGEPSVDESLVETAMDAANYWLLVAWLCRYGDTNE